MQKNVELNIHDLSQNPLSDEEILKLVTKGPGQMRAPVFVVEDKVILGFNRDRLEELLSE